MPYDPRIEAAEKLTDRQREVLRLIAKHYVRKEIARMLGITDHTVKAHIDEARKRLGAANEKQAARFLSEIEAQLGITSNRQYPEEVMAETLIEPDVAGHEQAFHSLRPTRSRHDHSFRGSTASLVNDSDAEQGALRRRGDSHLESHGADIGSSTSDLYHDHGNGVADGRKRLFIWRLDELSRLQCIVLIIGLTMGLAFTAVILLSTSATTFQAIQNITGHP